MIYFYFIITFYLFIFINFIRVTLVQSSVIYDFMFYCVIYDFMFYCANFTFLKALSIPRKLPLILASICSLK